MKHRFPQTLVLAGALLAAAATHAAAQDTAFRPSRSLVPARFPRWDVSGSLGFQSVAIRPSPEPWRGEWDQKLEYRADVGRYWTTHLKTEFAVATTNRFDDYEVDVFPPGAGALSPVYAYTIVERRVTALAPALTWQFGENAFMHPYVSGGVQLSIVEQHRVRSPDTYRAGPSGFEVPSIDERTTTVLGRPFVAGGFKSYLSRAAFVRTEARAAFAPAGLRQVSVIAGVGVDF